MSAGNFDLEYPEHAKQRPIIDSGENDVVARVFEWLNEQGIVLAHWEHVADLPDESELHDIEDAMPDILFPQGEGVSYWVHRFFGIDWQKIEDEKERMLDRARAQNGGTK